MKVYFIKLLIFFFVIFSVSNNLSAQPTSADTAKPIQKVSSSYAEAAINYISNIVFAGRKDSVDVPYLSPVVGYSHKSGLFVRGSLSYLTSPKESRVDLFTLTAGYVYSKNDFIAGLDATKYFFNINSTNVQSGMSGYAALFSGYRFNNILTVYVDGMMTFNSKPDFILGSEVNHTFYTLHDQLKITPTVYINFGTQNYYNEYYSHKHSGTGGGYGNGGGGGTQTTSVSVIESTKFQLLDYEFSLPVSYNFKQLTVFCTPVFAIPVNPSLITIDGQTTREVLSNSFFWSAGIAYRFAEK